MIRSRCGGEVVFGEQFARIFGHGDDLYPRRQRRP